MTSADMTRWAVHDTVPEDEQGDQEFVIDSHLPLLCTGFGKRREDLSCTSPVNLTVSKHEPAFQHGELMQGSTAKAWKPDSFSSAAITKKSSKKTLQCNGRRTTLIQNRTREHLQNL